MARPARLALCSLSVVLVAANAGVAGAQTRPAVPAAATAPVGAGTSGATAPVMSESKFLGALYSEIEKHTPAEHTLGDGEVTASFRVNATGRIDRVTIDKTSSPAHAAAVKQILGAVVAPPPPGGSMDVGQTFKFHKSEPEEPVGPAASSPSPETVPGVAPKPAPTAPSR